MWEAADYKGVEGDVEEAVEMEVMRGVPGEGSKEEEWLDLAEG